MHGRDSLSPQCLTFAETKLISLFNFRSARWPDQPLVNKLGDAFRICGNIGWCAACSEVHTSKFADNCVWINGRRLYVVFAAVGTANSNPGT